MAISSLLYFPVSRRCRLLCVYFTFCGSSQCDYNDFAWLGGVFKTYMRAIINGIILQFSYALERRKLQKKRINLKSIIVGIFEAL